jgi:acetoin utilization protein AcuB
MSRPVITLTPDVPVQEALAIFRREHIRRAPVMKGSKLVGIVSSTDLLHASASSVTSLSVWELHYLLSRITVSRVMTRKVLTVTEDTPIEEAARVMADNKIGGLPVMRDGVVIGIITETDLFKLFLEFMGAREKGVRITALIDNKRGQLAAITKSVADAGGNFLAFGQFAGTDPTTRLVTMKIAGLAKEGARKALRPTVRKIIDIR